MSDVTPKEKIKRTIAHEILYTEVGTISKMAESFTDDNHILTMNISQFKQELALAHSGGVEEGREKERLYTEKEVQAALERGARLERERIISWCNKRNEFVSKISFKGRTVLHELIEALTPPQEEQ